MHATLQHNNGGHYMLNAQAHGRQERGQKGKISLVAFWRRNARRGKIKVE